MSARPTDGRGRAGSTERKARIAQLLEQGLTYQQIAQRLGMHATTVWKYVKGLANAKPCC